MSRNFLVQAHLEYLVEQGLKKGLTEKQAIEYANNIFFFKRRVTMNKELYFKRRANLKTAIRQAKSLEFKQVWVSKTIELDKMYRS